MAAYETYETDAVYDEMDNNPTVGNVSCLWRCAESWFCKRIHHSHWKAPESMSPPPKEANPPPKRENEKGINKVGKDRNHYLFFHCWFEIHFIQIKILLAVALTTILLLLLAGVAILLKSNFVDSGKFLEHNAFWSSLISYIPTFRNSRVGLASKPRFLSKGWASQSVKNCVFGTCTVSWHYTQDNWIVLIPCSWIEAYQHSIQLFY